MSIQQFPCPQCGANLAFKPDSTLLVCANCGHEEEFTPAKTAIVELDYAQHLTKLGAEADTHEVLTVKCQRCGAETTLEPNVTASNCPFCGTPMVMTSHSQRLIKPQSLLPFSINHDKAQELFRDWLKSLWFAPNGLLKQAYSDETDIKGIYLPHWTYDCETTSQYTGERGEHYYETEHYTETDDKGNTVHKTRQVRKTHWYPASGVVHDSFDDILVVATDSLPPTYIEMLEPWDLPQLVPYQAEYLSGFRSESYRIPLPDGFEVAKTKMASKITASIKADIGGDVQRIHSQTSHHDNVTFKHILLPTWLNAYRYQEEIYRFLVNARTGEVQGERPLSWWKIIFAVLLDLILASMAAYGGSLVTAEDYIAVTLGGVAILALIGLMAIYMLASEGHRKAKK